MPTLAALAIPVLLVAGLLGDWRYAFNPEGGVQGPVFGAFSDPFKSVRLAPNPTNTYVLTTDGEDSVWAAPGAASADGTWSTTSASYFSSLGLAFSTTSVNYWETTQAARGGGGFSTTSAAYFESQYGDWNLTGGFLTPTTTIGLDVNATSTLVALSLNGATGVSASESTGGVLNINRGTALGPAGVLYTNAGVGGGRLLSIVSDNTAYDTQALHVRSDSDSETTLNVLGSPQGKGIIKAAANGVADANGSVVSLDASTSSYLGQLLFGICGTSTICTQIRDSGGTNQLFTLLGNGNLGLATSSPYAKLSVVGQVVGSHFTATTTSTNTFPNTSITKLVNLTGNGFVKTSGGDGTLSVDTTTYESGLTAGDGLTRTVNDFDCDTATSAALGCLSAANWSVFNNKVSTTSIDTITEVETLWGVSNILVEADIDASSELATIMDDETGTAGSLVFSAGPTFTGLTTFANATTTLFSTTYGSSTDQVIGRNFTFGGVTADTWPEFCETITGGAGLCDGSDASGSGGAGLATSTAVVDNYIAVGTSASDVGFYSNFTFDNAVNKLTVPSASTTLLSASTAFFNDFFATSTTATSTITNALQIGGTSGDNALKITAGRVYPASNSVGGMVNLTNTTNTGPALVAYTNIGATSAGNLANFRCDNTAMVHDCFKIDHDGAGDGLAIAATASASNALSLSNTGVDHTASIAYTGSTADKGALNLTSTNALGSVFQIAGNADSLGVGKITHNAVGTSDSSILSLSASSASYAGQGIFLDMGSSTLLQKVLNIRADGNEVLTTTSGGTTTVPQLTVSGALSFFANYYDSFANFANGVVNAVTSATLTGTWNFSGATVKGHTYSSFTYATSTAWTGTTTIPMGPAYTAEDWVGVKCFTDAGTLEVSFNDATNRMNWMQASTTVGTVTLSTNDTFTAGEKRYVDIGTPASSPTKISCTVDKIVNN
jgi:hypothetical protein